MKSEDAHNWAGKPKPLRIWIVQNGEELPTDPGPPRLLRQAVLADLLTERGHAVTFWTSSYIHQQKHQRPPSMYRHRTPAGYEVRLLRARSYAGNVSKERILSHRDAATSFRHAAPCEQRPDLVVAGYPTIELAHAAVEYCKERGIPTLVDFRDQWPDIIEAQARGVRGTLLRPVIAHWRHLQRLIVRDATAVCGITDEFVDWALESGRRSRGPLDRSFPLSPPPPAPTASAEQLAAVTFWDELVGPKGPGQIWGAYAGSLGGRTDLLTLVDALEGLDSDTANSLRVIVCGRGDLEADVQLAAERIPSLIYAGRRNAAEVRELLSRCDIGILPYRQTTDYLISYPNKLGEFLSFGLPVLTGLGGISGQLLDKHDLMLEYRAEDAASCRDALTRIVSDPPGAQAAARARSVFDRIFSPEVVYPAYADHIEWVARSEARPRGATTFLP